MSNYHAGSYPVALFSMRVWLCFCKYYREMGRGRGVKRQTMLVNDVVSYFASLQELWGW